MFELLSRYSGECTGQGGIDAVCHFVYPCLPGLVFMASASVSVLLAMGKTYSSGMLMFVQESSRSSRLSGQDTREASGLEFCECGSMVTF